MQTDPYLDHIELSANPCLGATEFHMNGHLIALPCSIAPNSRSPEVAPNLADSQPIAAFVKHQPWVFWLESMFFELIRL